MPPRKPSAATTDDNTTDPPRRSNRIASQPVAEAKPKPAAKVTKKRTADEAKEGEEASSGTKKVSQTVFLGGYKTLQKFLYLPFQTKPDPESVEEAAGSSSSQALPSIDIGGSLPNLTLKNEKGEDIQVEDLASEKGVIIFLVPKADTRASFQQSKKGALVLTNPPPTPSLF